MELYYWVSDHTIKIHWATGRIKGRLPVSEEPRKMKLFYGLSGKGKRQVIWRRWIKDDGVILIWLDPLSNKGKSKGFLYSIKGLYSGTRYLLIEKTQR